MRAKRSFFTIVITICIVFLDVSSAFAIDTGEIPEDKMSENDAGEVTQASVATTSQAIATTSQAVATMSQTVTLSQQAITLAQKPTFQLELTEKAGVQGLYGTLSYIPENTLEILVLYSFGGEYYSVLDKDSYGFRKWDLTGLKEGETSLTQICIGANDNPLKAYLHETVNTLYVKLAISQIIQEESVVTYTEAVKLSHNKIYEAPESPPGFTAVIEATKEGYRIKGTYTDTFLPSTIRIRPMYSLDGENYQVICEQSPYDWHLDQLGTEDEDGLDMLNNQTCSFSSVEPLKSYLAGEIASFYIKLQITLENGVCYDTKPSQITRGMVQPIPDDATLSVLFPGSMRAKNWRPFYTYGKYQITVREDASLESIYAMLPDTVPVEIQIELGDSSRVPVVANMEVAVSWKNFTDIDLKAGETLTINDSANELVIPAGTQLNTPQGRYLLSHDLLFDGIYSRDDICLVLNVIAKDEKAMVSLCGTQAGEAIENQLPISLAFSLKPSGATAIKAYSYKEGDTSWTSIGDLLTQRAIDTNQSEQLYGYIDVLQPTDTSYQRYLQGDVPGLLIALIIEGGVYDGETVILPWPYEYNLPIKVPELNGSGGNENNAGSGDSKEKDGSSDGGQRPDLPGNDLPSNDSETPPLVSIPLPTPVLTPVFTPVPTPASEPSPTLSPAATPASGPTPTLIPVPTPSIEPTQAINKTVTTEPEVTPEADPDFDPATLAMDDPEITNPSQGHSSAATDHFEVDFHTTQQETPNNFNTYRSFTEPVEDGNITAHSSVEPNKPSAKLHEKSSEEAVSKQVSDSAEPSKQTAPPEERTAPRKTNLPKAVTVGVLAVGSIATIGIAGAAGTSSTASLASKLITVLKKLLLRK